MDNVALPAGGEEFKTPVSFRMLVEDFPEFFGHIHAVFAEVFCQYQFGHISDSDPGLLQSFCSDVDASLAVAKCLETALKGFCAVHTAQETLVAGSADLFNDLSGNPQHSHVEVVEFFYLGGEGEGHEYWFF